jgi:hypothetical protein
VLRKRYEAALQRAPSLGADSIRSADASLAAASSRSVGILLGCLAVMLVIGLAVAYWLSRSLAVPLANLLALLGGPERLRLLP